MNGSRPHLSRRLRCQPSIDDYYNSILSASLNPVAKLDTQSPVVLEYERDCVLLWEGDFEWEQHLRFFAVAVACWSGCPACWAQALKGSRLIGGRQFVSTWSRPWSDRLVHQHNL